MTIKSPDNQITLYYDPSSRKGKQTLAYAKTHNLAISEIDIRKRPFTGTQLVEITDKLNISLKDLADTDSPRFFEKIGKAKEYDKESWIILLRENPELIKWPIALKGNHAILVATPSDILQL